MIIFLVEDDDFIVKLVSNSIYKYMPDAEIHVYSSVERAIANKKLEPDMILLDHFLDHTNGIEAIEVLVEFVPNVPIAVISKQDDQGLIDKALKDGASAFISKEGPFLENVKEFLLESANK